MIDEIKKQMNMLRKAVIPVTAIFFAVHSLSSCSDTWDDHYSVSDNSGQETLLQLIEDNPQLSDFLKVCKATHIYNNIKRTNVTYAELLASDQTLTVWAPVNGSFNADSLLSLCQTIKGDSGVAQHFVSNHISRNLYNMNSVTDASVKMFNDKMLSLSPTALGPSAVGSTNISATNGLLHILSSEAPYLYNIYEGITSRPEYAHIGEYLTRFERQELDEELSIVAGLEDGRKIYSDSVMYKYNALFRVLDYIDGEDSSFVMMVPSKDIWEKEYDKASKYYNYGSMEKADSVSGYWTNVALIQDLIFNNNTQRSPQDSIVSTSYNKHSWPYHVYYKPFADGGLMARTDVRDTLACSNGCIYNISNWPFDAKELYFHPVVVQGEREANIKGNTECTFNYRENLSPLVSGAGYLDIVPAKSTSNWTATFEIGGHLSGTYDICVVTLPKFFYLSTSKDTKPNKFTASLSYLDENGMRQTQSFSDEVKTSGTLVDTLKVGRFTFPVCNYGQPDATTSLTIQCKVGARETKYSREMFLDCIYLRPVSDEDIAAEEAAEEAKSRKEASK